MLSVENPQKCVQSPGHRVVTGSVTAYSVAIKVKMRYTILAGAYAIT
jgi:hypothetical protein